MKYEIVTRTHKNFTMSFYPCIECGNEVQPRRQALQCDDCGFWQHRICGTSIDQATYSLAGTRGRMDWLCVACSLAVSNPSEQVPVAESTRTDFAQGKEILSPRFVPEIILFWNKNLTFLGQVLSWSFFGFTIKMRFYFCLQIFLQSIRLLLISASQWIISLVSKKYYYLKLSSSVIH